MLPMGVMYALLIPCFMWFIRVKHRGRDDRASVALKALCTGVIVAAGAWGTLQAAPVNALSFEVLITAGLVLGLIGDVAICFHFKAGMLAFGLGHICYMAAIVLARPHLWTSAVVFILVWIVLIICFRKSLPLPGAHAQNPKNTVSQLLIPGAAYGLLLTSMFSLAAGMLYAHLPRGLVLFAGATLFIISDAVLAWSIAHDNLLQKNKTLDTACLCCYFAGQSLFAVCVFL